MIGNIDRISENYFVVILEDGKNINLKVSDYPQLKVGDIITFMENNVIKINEEETKILKEKNINLQNKLFNAK